MSTAEILARLSQLSPDERALIRERLDALDDTVMELSPEERRLVAERVASHHHTPAAGTTWAVAESEIRQELGL